MTRSEGEEMKSWDLKSLELAPHAPDVLSSTTEARAIALELPAGEMLQEHQVHERAWVAVVDGHVEVTAADGQTAIGGPGLLIECDPAERHTVVAKSTARLLLLLAPWPGEGHPGARIPPDKITQAL